MTSEEAVFLSKNLAAAAIVACTGLVPLTARAADDIVVTNLQYGPVCGEGDGMSICTQSSDIPLTGNGACVFNQQPIACTWYGYAFDYALSVPQVTLDCTWSSTAAGAIGNPNAVLAQKASSGTYAFTLKRDDHHFFNPQYTGANEDAARAETLTQSCSYQGHVLFDVKFNLHTPAS